MSSSQKNKIFRNTFFLIILAELLSFLGYYYPEANGLAFFLIVILTISVSLYRLEYGLYILFTELFIGSFGYLFYFAAEGFTISVRLALWLIVMSVCLAKIIIQPLKTKRLNLDFIKFREFSPFMVLFIFIGWGALNGWLNSNSLSNIFFDFNNWFYFLLIFPVFAVFKNSRDLNIIKQIFFAAITWLSLKTIILAYFFSHNFNGFIIDLYRWVRNSGVGEITTVQAGFSRIFMQSHIFILIGFFIALFYLLKIVIARSDGETCHSGLSLPRTTIRGAGIQGQTVEPLLSPTHRSRVEPGMAEDEFNLLPSSLTNDKKKMFIIFFLFSALFLSAIIISFSRSFWLGLSAGAVFVWLIALFKLKIKFKKFVIYNSLILLSIFLSLLLTVAVIKIPYPSLTGGFDPASALSQRATQITNEAGASSRWQLLPVLWQEIKTAPIMGRGFGATVTYKTNDPRILAANPDGLYTTYAFEWGWLDVWLKLGLLGLLAYLGLFIKIIIDGLKTHSYLALSLTAGLIVLMVVNIFSPYINHPLGIGYLIITACLINFIKETGTAKA